MVGANPTIGDFMYALPTAMRADVYDKPGLQPAEWLFIVWAALVTLITVKYARALLFRMSDKDILPGRSPSRGI